jgi:hypothetical protein
MAFTTIPEVMSPLLSVSPHYAQWNPGRPDHPENRR